jgi:hypothetical protein
LKTQPHGRAQCKRRVPVLQFAHQKVAHSCLATVPLD